MNNDLLTVVIPTRNRQDTLLKIVEHLLELALPATRVLISDNFSDPSVQDCLPPLPSQFSVVRTESRLSMPANWRFAIPKVSTPYFTVIGDDDILWGNRLVSLFPLLDEHKVPVIFWYRYCYYWTTFRDKVLAGFLLLTKDSSLNSVDLDDLFANVFPRTLVYQWLPSVYNSIIRTETARSIFGNLEDLVPADSIAPDVASAFRICSNFRKGIHCASPISISGISHHSNGMNPELQSQFWSEFKEIRRRPTWLANSARPTSRESADLLTLIHDYFSGAAIEPSFESKPVVFPPFFRQAIRDSYESGQLAVTKSGLETLLLSNLPPGEIFPKPINILEAGFFPNSEPIGVRVPSDFFGNEVVLISRYLNAL